MATGRARPGLSTGVKQLRAQNYLQDSIDKLDRDRALPRLPDWLVNQARRHRPEETRARAFLPLRKTRLCALSPAVVVIHANLSLSWPHRNQPAARAYGWAIVTSST